MSTTTDKPTIEEVREWQNQNHRYALRHHYDVKAIDFLLAEVDRLSNLLAIGSTDRLRSRRAPSRG